MSRRARIAIVLLGALIVASLLPSREPRELTASSFGETPSSHGALFELFVSLGLEPRRTMGPVDRLPSGTIWWIEPDGVCDGRIAMEGEVDVLDAEAVQWPVGPWIEEGSTAVVLLEHPGSEVVRCDAILGHALPERSGLLAEEEAVDVRQDEEFDTATAGADGDAEDAPVPGDPAPSIWDGRRHPEAGEEVELAEIRGPWAAAIRQIPVVGVRAFDDETEAGSGWQVVATAAAPGQAQRPFVLERLHGDGRLVVIADSSFVHNRRLDIADSAVLAVDLVRVYGEPQIDERAHGFVTENNAVRFLAGSPAMPVFAGLAALGLLVLWRGTALPARTVDVPDEEAPTLASYLRSMANLYARSRDYADVAERYRELCEAQVRRHFGLPPETPSEALAERIERQVGLSSERARRLTAPSLLPVETESALRAAARELDELVEEVIH